LLRGAAARAVSMVTKFGIISGESPHQLPQSRYGSDKSGGVCFFSLVLFVFFFSSHTHYDVTHSTEKHTTTATTQLLGYSNVLLGGTCLATNRAAHNATL